MGLWILAALVLLRVGSGSLSDSLWVNAEASPLRTLSEFFGNHGLNIAIGGPTAKAFLAGPLIDSLAG